MSTSIMRFVSLQSKPMIYLVLVYCFTISGVRSFCVAFLCRYIHPNGNNITYCNCNNRGFDCFESDSESNRHIAQTFLILADNKSLVQQKLDNYLLLSFSFLFSFARNNSRSDLLLKIMRRQEYIRRTADILKELLNDDLAKHWKHTLLESINRI